MRLLVSLPYSNNQWVYQWVRTSEQQNFNSLVLPIKQWYTGKQFGAEVIGTIKEYPFNTTIEHIKYVTTDTLSSSFSNDDFLKNTYGGLGLEEKIEYIEKSKKLNLNVCYNCETVDLLLPYKSKLVWDWFKEFYKKDVVLIVLLNKDLWKHWIKFLFYRTIFLKLPTLTDNDLILNTRDIWNADLIKSYIEVHNIQFTYKEAIWKDFLKNLRLLHEDIIGSKSTNARYNFAKNILWLEDLSTESLSLTFECGVSVSNTTTKSRLNYESYFSTKDLDFMKKQFNTYKENEFIYYGYK
jgi:hypothetical protein